MTVPMFTPTSCAACGLSATARIAVPSRVRWTIHCKASISAAATAMTASWLLDTASPPSAKFFTGNTAGNARGVAPNTPGCWNTDSSSSDTPMAVMRTLSVAVPRSGR